MSRVIEVGDVVRVLEWDEIEARSSGRSSWGTLYTRGAQFVGMMRKYCGGEYTVARVSFEAKTLLSRMNSGINSDAYQLEQCGDWWFSCDAVELVDGQTEQDCELVACDFDVEELF